MTDFVPFFSWHWKRLGDYYEYQCCRCGVRILATPGDSVFREHRCTRHSIILKWLMFNYHKQGGVGYFFYEHGTVVAKGINKNQEMME